MVQTPSCENRHVGYVISGSLHVVMDDGTDLDIRAGDAFEIPPGHDAWVVGDEPWDTVEFASAAIYGATPDANESVLATILFTDIVDSTARLSLMGDVRWRKSAAPAQPGCAGATGSIPRTRGRHDRRRLPGPVRWRGPCGPMRAVDDQLPSATWTSRSERGCTREKSSSRVDKRAGWPYTRPRESPPWPARARSWSARRPATCLTDPASRSRAGASTSSRASPAHERSTPSRAPDDQTARSARGFSPAGPDRGTAAGRRLRHGCRRDGSCTASSALRRRGR